MISESAKEKLSRYQYTVNERDLKLEKEENVSKRHDIVLLYGPPINKLACDFANQIIEDLNSDPTEQPSE